MKNFVYLSHLSRCVDAQARAHSCQLPMGANLIVFEIFATSTGLSSCSFEDLQIVIKSFTTLVIGYI